VLLFCLTLPPSLFNSDPMKLINFPLTFSLPRNLEVEKVSPRTFLTSINLLEVLPLMVPPPFLTWHLSVKLTSPLFSFPLRVAPPRDETSHGLALSRLVRLRSFCVLTSGSRTLIFLIRGPLFDKFSSTKLLVFCFF